MVDILITSSALILLICVIRYACMGRISRRLQYALWLIVVLRLLIPFSLFDNAYNYAQLIKPVIMPEEQGGNPSEDEPMEIAIEPDITPVKKNTEKTGEKAVLLQMFLEEEPVSAAKVVLRARNVLKIIWCVGMGVCALVIMTGNLVFYCRLRKERIEISKRKNVKIYQTNVFTTPCLYGFFRPSIYMTEESLADKDRVKLILLHEYTHYRHLDYIWSMVRCLCVCIYWFHPLVWLAAMLSVRDSELACDESVLKQIGEEQRGIYGQTVLEFAVGNGGTGILYCATGMAGDKKELRERIKMIAGKNRVMIVVSVFVIAVMTFAFISAFGGRQNEETVSEAGGESIMESSAENQEAVFEYNLKKSSIIEYEGVLYLLDKTDAVLLAVRPDTCQVETVCDMEKSDLANDIWLYKEQLYFVRGVKTKEEEMMQFQLETVRLSDYEHWVVCTLECAAETDFAFENGCLYYLCICPTDSGNIYTLHQVSVVDEEHQIVSYIMELGEQLMVRDGYCYYNAGGKLYQVKLAGGEEGLIAENVYDYDLGASHIYYMVPDKGVYRADIKSGSVQLFYDGNLTKSHNFGVYVDKGEENILLYSKAVGINYLNSDGKLLNYNPNFVPASFAGTEGITQNWFVCESGIGGYYLAVTPLNRLLEEDIIFLFTIEGIQE